MSRFSIQCISRLASLAALFMAVCSQSSLGGQVGQLRQQTPGAACNISDVIVTATFPGFFFVQDDDRAAGIRVVSEATVTEGDMVSVSGVLQHLDCDLVIMADDVTVSASLTPTVLPLHLRASESGNPVFRGDGGIGLPSSGLCVAVSGKITRVSTDSVFINDGSLPSDGLMVICDPSKYKLGDHVEISGVSVAMMDAGTCRNALLEFASVTQLGDFSCNIELQGHIQGDSRPFRLVFREGGNDSSWWANQVGRETLNPALPNLFAMDTLTRRSIRVWWEDTRSIRQAAWFSPPSDFSGRVTLVWGKPQEKLQPWRVINAGLNASRTETIGNTYPWKKVAIGQATYDGVLCNYNHVAVIKPLSNGELMLVWSGGPYAEDSPIGEKYVFQSFSSDEGQTWSVPTILDLPQSTANRYPSALFSDGDKIFFLFSEWALLDTCYPTIYLTTSTDHGRTWTEPVELGAQAGVLSNEGGQVVVWNGVEHWVFSAYEECAHQGRAYLIISNDKGQTWFSRQMGDGDRFLARYEPAIALHPDGRVVAYARTYSSNLWRAFSYDQGHTWTPWERSELLNPHSKPHMVHMGGERLVLCNNDWRSRDDKKGTRRNLTLYVSDDFGQTWSKQIGLFDGTSMGVGYYPALQKAANGDLLAFYTGGRMGGPVPDSSILQTQIPASDLEQDRHNYSSGLAFNVQPDRVILHENGQCLQLRPPYGQWPSPSYPIRFGGRFSLAPGGFNNLGWQLFWITNANGASLSEPGYETWCIVGRRKFFTYKDDNIAVHNGHSWIQTDTPFPIDREFELEVEAVNDTFFRVYLDGQEVYAGARLGASSAVPMHYFLGSQWPAAGPFGFQASVYNAWVVSDPNKNPEVRGNN